MREMDNMTMTHRKGHEETYHEPPEKKKHTHTQERNLHSNPFPAMEITPENTNS